MLRVGRTAKHICFTLLAVLQLTCPSTVALAQMATPQPLTSAVPEEWRGPYTQFLTSLGLKNPTAVIASTKFGHIGSIYRQNSAVLRIEDESACREDMCLTLIGHLVDGHFVADAQFVAGPNMAKHDSTQQIIGIHAFPVFFEGGTSTIELVETTAGWIVIP